MMDDDGGRVDVLIVDDDDAIRDVLSAILREEGYQVADAAGGQAALDFLTAGTGSPGLILLDLMMPAMNGWQFLELREQDAQLSRIPVVVLSGVAGLQQTGLRSVEARIEKPIRMDQLLDIVERYCQRR